MKIKSEAESRKKIRQLAQELGCLPDLDQIFSKYDRMMFLCQNNQEREAIGVMGVAEVHKLLDFHSKLVVNGQLILDGPEDQLPTSKIEYLGS